MSYVKHILFFFAGLIYSVILTFFGLIYTGMGHGTGTSVFWILALSPVPLIYWAAVGLLMIWVRLQSVRIIIVCLVLLHYLTFVLYSYNNLTNSQYEDFPAVWHRDPIGIMLTVTVYLMGQLVVWGLLVFSNSSKHHIQSDGKIKIGNTD